VEKCADNGSFPRSLTRIRLGTKFLFVGKICVVRSHVKIRDSLSADVAYTGLFCGKDTYVLVSFRHNLRRAVTCRNTCDSLSADVACTGLFCGKETYILVSFVAKRPTYWSLLWQRDLHIGLFCGKETYILVSFGHNVSRYSALGLTLCTQVSFVGKCVHWRRFICV